MHNQIECYRIKKEFTNFTQTIIQILFFKYDDCDYIVLTLLYLFLVVLLTHMKMNDSFFFYSIVFNLKYKTYARIHPVKYVAFIRTRSGTGKMI